MITEVITYIRQQCVVAGITTAYQDLIPSSIPSTELLNVCAVRSLPGAQTINTISGADDYSIQLFSILYRGLENDRLTSLDNIDSAWSLLNKKAEVELTNTRIASIIAQKPAYAYEDENGIIHYNMNLTVTYNKK